MTEEIENTDNIENTENSGNPELNSETTHYYGMFNQDGFPIAFYNTDVNPTIPDDATEITREQWLEFINNQGLRRWENGTIVVYTPPGPTDEQKWFTIRNQRNGLLSLCDWTQLADVPMTTAKRNDWKTYRQDLRDIPQTQDVDNVLWPTQPS